MSEEKASEVVDGDGSATVHRIPIEYSGYYAVREPEPGGVGPPALLIAMHGYGQSCKNFIRNFRILRDQNFLVVAPQALNQFYWEQGRVGFTWVTSYMLEQTMSHVFDYLGRTLRAIEQEYTFDPARVFLFGFSNGAAMAFRLGASGLVKPAGIIACCGDLPEDVAERLAELDKFPVLLLHGEEDSMVHAEKSREAEAALRANGFEVDTIFFPGGHELRYEEMERVRDWLCAKASTK